MPVPQTLSSSTTHVRRKKRALLLPPHLRDFRLCRPIRTADRGRGVSLAVAGWAGAQKSLLLRLLSSPASTFEHRHMCTSSSSLLWMEGGKKLGGKQHRKSAAVRSSFFFPQHPKTERNFLGQEKLVVSQSVPPPRFLTKGRLVDSSIVKRSLNCCAKL